METVTSNHSPTIVHERNEKGFFALLDAMANELKKRDAIVVIHHYDADGVSSGAITIKALERAGKKVKSICLKQLYKENIPQIRELGSTYVFVDFGSGQLDYLTEAFRSDFFVLDHHEVLHTKNADGSATPFSHYWHANPLLFGINGGTEISGAGVAFFFAHALDTANADLSPLAIVGALGDMQDSHGALSGLNRRIITIAEYAHLLNVRTDLRLYGRISRPLVSFLCFSSSPMLPELTASDDNCRSFLNQAGIPLQEPITQRWLSYEDLPLEKKRALSSALITHLYSHNVPEWKIKELVGEVYTLMTEFEKSPLRDGKEFATMLNACGRHAMPHLALAVCLGNREMDGAYGQALAMMAEHRQALAKGIQFIHDTGVTEMKSYYFFDAGETIQDSLVGIIAGMLYGSVISETKPIIAFARNPQGEIKMSGRGTSELLRRGLNIGGAFKAIEKKVEGFEGGGHKIAAGAKFPADKKEDVMALIETEFALQLAI